VLDASPLSTWADYADDGARGPAMAERSELHAVSVRILGGRGHRPRPQTAWSSHRAEIRTRDIQSLPQSRVVTRKSAPLGHLSLSALRNRLGFFGVSGRASVPGVYPTTHVLSAEPSQTPIGVPGFADAPRAEPNRLIHDENGLVARNLRSRPPRRIPLIPAGTSLDWRATGARDVPRRNPGCVVRSHPSHICQVRGRWRRRARTVPGAEAAAFGTSCSEAD
jgi:hypothetical protein